MARLALGRSYNQTGDGHRVASPRFSSVLPELPPELEYRFVCPDLVLVDILGSVVEDVLRDAVPTIETAPPS
jgi:hypothetical protein